MKTKKSLIILSCFLLIVLVGATGNSSAQQSAGAQIFVKLLGRIMHLSQNRLSGTARQLENNTPRLILTSGGNDLEVWCNIQTDDSGTLWFDVSIDNFQNNDYTILTGEIKISAKRFAWAMLINKTD